MNCTELNSQLRSSVEFSLFLFLSTLLLVIQIVYIISSMISVLKCINLYWDTAAQSQHRYYL